jgi:hypothetical protein
MNRRFAARDVYTVSVPKNRFGSMIRALKVLYSAPRDRHDLAIACLIVCYMDAMAARGGEATRPKFLRFLRSNFKQLCTGLDGMEPKMDGAEVFYRFYRSEMVHTFFSRNTRYALAEDHELKGAYAGYVPVSGRSVPLIAINVDRLYRDFVALARRKAKGKSL